MPRRLHVATTDNFTMHISDSCHQKPYVLHLLSETVEEFKDNSKHFLNNHISGLILVSDAIEAQGLADGNYNIGTKSVTVEGGRAYVTGTKTLCGSTAALDECVKIFKEATGNKTNIYFWQLYSHRAQSCAYSCQIILCTYICSIGLD